MRLGDDLNLSMMSSNDVNKSFIQRTIGPLGEGSIRGSILTLTASACGSGFLLFPGLCTKVGLIVGIILIMMACLGTYLSHYMLLLRAG